jgi:hypothetical protein
MNGICLDRLFSATGYRFRITSGFTPHLNITGGSKILRNRVIGLSIFAKHDSANVNLPDEKNGHGFPLTIHCCD